MMAIRGDRAPLAILAGWIDDQAGWKAVFGSEVWLPRRVHLPPVDDADLRVGSAERR